MPDFAKFSRLKNRTLVTLFKKLPKVPKKLVQEFRALLFSLKSSTEAPLSKLKKIYDYQEEYNAFVSTFSVCKPKCSHCCRISVQITELEAQYISGHTGRKIQISRQPRSSSVLENPCPFLDKNELCSIYEFRPFNCRAFHTLDNPNFCKDPNFPHIVYGCAEFEYGSDILRELRAVIHSLNVSLHPRLPLADIRDFF